MKIKGKFTPQTKIYQKDWVALHPLSLQSSTDFYYIQLSNRILKLLEENIAVNEFSSSLKRQFAIVAAAYFEDVISNIGVWKGFRQIHFDKYGRYLPFLETTDDYYLDEINPEDIQFLIWSILQFDVIENEELRFLNIENPIISYVSLIIYEILDKEYESAPENEAFYNAVHSPRLASDFYLFREFVKWIHSKSYLSGLYPEKLINSQKEKLKNSTDDYFKKNYNAINYAISNSMIFTSPCSPLAISSTEWFAEITTDIKVKEIAKSLEYKKTANYLIVDFDEDVIKVKQIDDQSVMLDLDANSLESKEPFKTSNTVTCELAYFDRKWQVNGMAAFGLVDDKNNLKQDNLKQNEIESKIHTYQTTLTKNNGSPIAFFKNAKELATFLLKLFPDSPRDQLYPKDMKNDENIVVFTHPTLGLVMLPDMATLIKSKNNSLYNNRDASDHAISILCGAYVCPRVLLEYLITNNLIPDAYINSLKGTEYGRKLVQKNLDFIIRFFQPELYSL